MKHLHRLTEVQFIESFLSAAACLEYHSLKRHRNVLGNHKEQLLRTMIAFSNLGFLFKLTIFIVIVQSAGTYQGLKVSHLLRNF